MCFYYRVCIGRPDKASPTSREFPPLGPESAGRTGNSDAYAGPGVAPARQGRQILELPGRGVGSVEVRFWVGAPVNDLTVIYE
jgi:hypothetical protein